MSVGKLRRFCLGIWFVVMLAMACPVAAQSGLHDPGDDQNLADSGGTMSAIEAGRLERKLIKSPDDLATRVRLLGYYFIKQYRSHDAKVKFEQNVLWIIEHRPASGIAASPYAHLYKKIDGDAYEKGKALWLKQVDTHPTDDGILLNASQYFLINDRGIAEGLLLKGQAKNPNIPEWPEDLAEVYTLSMGSSTDGQRVELAKKALACLERARQLGYTDEPRQLDLPRVAYEAGEYDKSRQYATEQLKIADSQKEQWDYGELIFDGNVALGRLALHDGDIAKSEDYLLAAGKTPGSPSLDSFGPNMTLAKELLDHGQSGVVLQFFKECSAFWDTKDLKDWTAEVKNGKVPDFRANMDY